MLDRAEIEKVLRINGLAVNATDEEIKQVLTRARWHPNDVIKAVQLLKHAPPPNPQTKINLAQALRSDEKMSPDTISALLGIDMKVEQIQRQQRVIKGVAHNITTTAIVLLCIVLFAAGLVFALMWYFKVGYFFEAV